MLIISRKREEDLDPKRGTVCIRGAKVGTRSYVLSTRKVGLTCALAKATFEEDLSVLARAAEILGVHTPQNSLSVAELGVLTRKANYPDLRSVVASDFPKGGTFLLAKRGESYFMVRVSNDSI